MSLPVISHMDDDSFENGIEIDEVTYDQIISKLDSDDPFKKIR